MIALGNPPGRPPSVRMSSTQQNDAEVQPPMLAATDPSERGLPPEMWSEAEVYGFLVGLGYQEAAEIAKEQVVDGPLHAKPRTHAHKPHAHQYACTGKAFAGCDEGELMEEFQLTKLQAKKVFQHLRCLGSHPKAPHNCRPSRRSAFPRLVRRWSLVVDSRQCGWCVEACRMQSLAISGASHRQVSSHCRVGRHADGRQLKEARRVEGAGARLGRG